MKLIFLKSCFVSWPGRNIFLRQLTVWPDVFHQNCPSCSEFRPTARPTPTFLKTNLFFCKSAHFIGTFFILFAVTILTRIICKDSRKGSSEFHIGSNFIGFMVLKWSISRTILLSWFQGNLRYHLCGLCYKKPILPKRMTIS